MNNFNVYRLKLPSYLAQYIPPEKVHDKMFPARFITPDSYPTLVRRNRLMAKQEKPADEDDKKKHRGRIEFKISRAVNALKDMGIDYFPQIYDPEAEKYVTQTLDSDMDTDEVPELVSIQPVATENTPKKEKKEAKKNAGKVVTTKDSPASVHVSQTEESTLSKKSSRKKTPAKNDNKRVSDSANTPNEKSKDADVDCADEDTAKKPATSVKASSIPTKVSIKASPLPAKTSVESSPSPAKASPFPASKKSAKQSKIPTASKSSEATATTSPKPSGKPSPKPNSKKAKPKSLIKEVASPTKKVTRSAKGKKAV